MSAKHTPGPWKVMPYGKARGIPVQRGKEGGFLVYGKSKKREIADANLIVSAPDLLAALEKAVEHYGKPGGPWNVPSDPGTWIADARAAIAKAKGEGA